MSQPRRRNSPPTIDLGRSEIPLGPWRATVLLTMFVALVVAISYLIFSAGSEGPVGEAVAGVIMVVSPLVIGLLVSPVPKPADHSIVAVQAVSELDELRRGNRALVEELLQVDAIHDRSHAQFVIVKNADELHRQFERLGQALGHWIEVSPDVGNLIIEKEARLERVLQDMERAGKGEEPS